MKLAIVGTGYVGLVTGICFAEMGNEVWCIDNDKDKVDSLNQLKIPIYEPGLETMLENNYKQGNIKFSTDIQTAVEQSEICIISVGTPQAIDGSADLQYVLAVARDIGKHMNKHTYVVDKSTVPVGTADKVKKEIRKQLDARNADLTFDVISNPEFLREGAAVNDCMRPDRVVIGTDNEKALRVMKELYLPFIRNTENFIAMDVKSAEMTKYAANAMLATKISFMNEMANICDRVGADVNKVRIGIGSDQRIGYQFIYPGCGYGGSCFPKDIQALIQIGIQFGYDTKILKSVEEVNQRQKLYLVHQVIGKYGENLSGYVFAVWGLAFKPDTDDMREASSIVIIQELIKRGAIIKAHDPKAMDEAKNIYLKDNLNISYYERKYDALKDSDAMLLITEWKEFRSPDFHEIKNLLKHPVIFDGRNQYNRESLREFGFEYYQVGVGNC
ncbi:MAG: UDP-glucose/GDP-mannose dehydrogenase family protein [Clostridia bacterium]